MISAQAQRSTAFALALCALGCNEDTASPTRAEPTEDAATEDAATEDAATEDAEDAATEDAATEDAATEDTCTIASSCLDIDIPQFTYQACCTKKSSCGYLLPELTPETLMYFPDLDDFFAMVVEDDPNGRCAPESFVLGPQEGFTEERFEAEGSEDILVATSCSSFHIGAFSLAGCCLPDDTCGLSTHASAPTLGYLADDPDAPFGHPECVHAEVLNQQLRDSKLQSLARTTSSGTCSYAEIDARQPNKL